MAGTAAKTHVLRADPSLGDGLPPAVAEHVLLLAVARSEWLPAGPWVPHVPEDERPGHLGLLVLEGLVAGRALLLERRSVELLGPGDLWRPWQPADAAPFAAGVTWEALMPTHVAVLDRGFAAIVGRWPEIVAALADRAVQRSRHLLLAMAVTQIPQVHLRLLATLWQIALRWGHADADGVVVPVRLPHELLASLVSARRQTTTGALSRLVAQGLVSRRADNCLVLHGDPPADLAALSGAVL